MLRGLGRPALVALAVIGLLAGSAYATSRHLFPALAKHPYFAVRSVSVVADADYSDPRDLASRAGVYSGTGIWDLDTRAAERALTGLGWVRSASVVRRFPDRVRISVEAHRPAALTLLAAVPHLVAQDGTLYLLPDAAALPDLPWVTGWHSAASRGTRVRLIRRALALAREADNAGIRVSQIDCRSDGSMTVYLDAPRLPVTFGPDSALGEPVGRLALLLERMPEAELAAARHIDLSFERRAIVSNKAPRSAYSARSKEQEPGRG